MMEIEFLSTQRCLFSLVQDLGEVWMERGGIRCRPKLVVQREEYGVWVQTDLGLLSGSSTYWLSDLGLGT